jgi:hypothetical protein
MHLIGWKELLAVGFWLLALRFWLLAFLVRASALIRGKCFLLSSPIFFIRSFVLVSGERFAFCAS